MATYREVNSENASKVKKGALIMSNGKAGKVIYKDVKESFGFILYKFLLDNMETIKIVKSTL